MGVSCGTRAPPSSGLELQLGKMHEGHPQERLAKHFVRLDLVWRRLRAATRRCAAMARSLVLGAVMTISAAFLTALFLLHDILRSKAHTRAILLSTSWFRGRHHRACLNLSTCASALDTDWSCLCGRSRRFSSSDPFGVLAFWAYRIL